MKFIRIVLLFIFICFSFGVNAQNTNKISTCEDYLHGEFISDGQYNTTIIKKGETKKTKITLLGGNTFRIVACAENTDKLQFSLIDQNGTVLFTNKNFAYAPYWDFDIKNTMECTVSLYIDDATITKDKTIFIIGYKR